MKRTITATLQELRSGQLARKLSLGHDNCTITITYDDGKPNTKTVWEWMVTNLEGSAFISDVLCDEIEASCHWPERPHKKLREFQVEVSDAE